MDMYRIVRKIGSGSYGQVWLVKHKKDKKQYVLKQINLQNASKREIRASHLEVQLLASLRHPNIVCYRDAFESDDGFLYIAMAYCEGGDMYTRIKEQQGVHFDEARVVEWFIQICLALQYLHERNILHRDLKTQNIFLTRSKVIKVGDLGIAKVLDSDSAMATTLIGTPYYMSPELFSNKPYNHKSDVWALGCCVYEMATLHHAFNARDINSLMYKILKGKLPPMPRQYGAELVALISAMLNQSPERRPSVLRLLRDPFVKRNIAVFLEGTRVSTRPDLGRSPNVSANNPDAAPNCNERLQNAINECVLRNNGAVRTAAAAKREQVTPRGSPSKDVPKLCDDLRLDGQNILHCNNSPVKVSVANSSVAGRAASGDRPSRADGDGPVSSRSATSVESCRAVPSGEQCGVKRATELAVNGFEIKLEERNGDPNKEARMSPRRKGVASAGLTQAGKSPATRPTSSQLPAAKKTCAGECPVDDDTFRQNVVLFDDGAEDRSSKLFADREQLTPSAATPSALNKPSRLKRRMNKCGSTDGVQPPCSLAGVGVDSAQNVNTPQPVANDSVRVGSGDAAGTQNGVELGKVGAGGEVGEKDAASKRGQRPIPSPPARTKTACVGTSPHGSETETSGSSSISSSKEDLETGQNSKQSGRNLSARQRRRAKLQQKCGFSASGSNPQDESEQKVEQNIQQVSAADRNGECNEHPPSKNDNKDLTTLLTLLNNTLHDEITNERSSPERQDATAPVGRGLANTRTRLVGRIDLLRRDCLQGLGVEILNEALQIINNFSNLELEMELQSLLGKDKFVAFVGKIWQLKFCEDYVTNSHQPEDRK